MTRADRARFYATLGVLALAITAVATCGACGIMPATRTPQQQHNASVQITVFCMPVDEDGHPRIDVDSGLPTVSEHFGSGTLVSAHEVLTAAHVPHCPEGDAEIMAVDVGDGAQHQASVDVLLPAADIARVHVEDDLGTWFTPLRVGPIPQVGDRVCAASAAPRNMYRCWTAQARRADPGPSADIDLDGWTEFGESGSGLFDDSGRLIGVVVSLTTCQEHLQCLGHATSVAAYPG